MVRLGAIAMVWLGVIVVLANFVYGITIMNDPELMIPLNAENKLEPNFGSSFYFSLATGIFCIFIGCLIWVFDFFAPKMTAALFNFTAAEFFQEEYHQDQPEYGVPSSGVCRTEVGVTVLRHGLHKKPHTHSTTELPSGSGCQHCMPKDANNIPLATITEVTVHVE